MLKYLIAKGTPQYCRQNLWLLCSGAKQEIANNTFYYENILKLSKEVPSLYEKQIDKDIKRTNSESLKKNPEFKTKMKNILIEEILPLNYYSQMCGIMAYMQVILDLLKKLMPKNI